MNLNIMRSSVLTAVVCCLAAAAMSVAALAQQLQPQATGTDAAVLARDDFDGKLTLRWDIRRADPAGVSLTKRPGFLTITTQEGDVIAANQSAKNLYLTRAPRPFTDVEITTCIDAFAPQESWNQAGLVCVDDDDNYVKFTIENNPDGGRRLIMIGEASGRSTIEGAADPAPEAQRLWLRITKQGRGYTFAVSADGAHFEVCGTQPWGRSNRLNAPRWVGLIAINGPDSKAPNIDASFDFFEVRQLVAESPAWTLDEALAHLRLYPRDAYVQYLALELARREGRLPEVAAQLAVGGRAANRFNVRRDQVDLFSIFSGSLAVQESLQLDAMQADMPAADRQLPPDLRRRVGPGPLPGQAADRRPAGPPTADVAVSDLTGPTIKSHPWEEMLAGRSPEISRLARCVPEDFYFAEFRSVNKLIEASELGDLWGTHLVSQSVQEAETQLVDRRLREQLAVETSPLQRPFYDAVVEEVAVAGSDMFLREGSDVTLLFHVRQPAVFRAKMDEFLTSAEQSRSDARRTSGNYLGVEFEHVATPDRQIHVFSAYPAPDLHVRSNSRAALERIVAAIRGKSADGQPVRRLGDTAEFAYIRTLMPRGAQEEDGFIYLSDPFIRRLVGPTLRLTEQRRLMCYNHLKMISHAALMYRTEHGANADSLGVLAAARCTPGEFGKGHLACPDGGQYSLADDGLTGVCSHHGYASYLTPCCEIETRRVTTAEADAYRRFLQEYNSYWRQYFDPIAIRLQMTPKHCRVETIVLPLIDNSIYTRLAGTLGGRPEPLDALPVPERNIFSFAVRLDKAELLRQIGMEGLLEEEQVDSADLRMAADRQKALVSLKTLAIAMHNYHDTLKRFPQAALVDAGGRALLSWRVQILPFLEEQELYEQFRLDEPWDSAHNRQLVKRIPDVLRPANRELAAAGKTRFVAPRGDNTIFPSDNRRLRFPDVQDGTSQTIMFLEADDERAVVWTKPDDLEIDPSQPQRGLAIRPTGEFLAAFCDGSVHRIAREIDQPALAALLTRAGRERPAWQPFARTPPPRRRGPFGQISEHVVRQLKLGELLTKGVGNQVAFHVYDADPAFDLSLSRLLGMAVGSFRGGLGFRNEMFGIALLVGSLNSPVYVSIPIQDAKVVDEFLKRLDDLLAELARRPSAGFFFSVDQDFYQLQPDQESPVRGYGLRVGPVKWRFFWSRIGKAVYVASHRDILTDLRALSSNDQPAAADVGRAAHALVRLRPQHWNRVLQHYWLGWEENNREACLNNLGPLSSLSRALSTGRSDASGPPTEAELREVTARLCDVHFFCPDGGRYEVSRDGESVTCSVHGSAESPRQTAAPAKKSEVGRMLRELGDVSVTLSFLEDGLHAVVDIERTSPSGRDSVGRR